MHYKYLIQTGSHFTLAKRHRLFNMKDYRVTKQQLSPILRGTWRLIVYGLLVFLLAEFMFWEAGREVEGDKFTESSYVEYLQTVLLLLSCLLLIWTYQKFHAFRYTAVLMFGFLGASLIREQDVFFETYIGMSTWQIPVYALLAGVVYIIIKNLSVFLVELEEYIVSTPFGLFLMGLLTTYVFSRLFGRTVFWNAVMEDSYFRTVKNAAEECLELYGYLIIFISVIELLLLAKKRTQLWENQLQPRQLAA